MWKWIIGIAVLIVSIIVLFPAIIIFLLNNGNPIDKFFANRYVPDYLEEQGFTEDKLLEAHYVQPKHRINKDFYHGHYMVIFKDEPEMAYYYGVRKKGKEVKQFCERDWHDTSVTIDYYDSRNTSKHLRTDCVNSLDNR